MEKMQFRTASWEAGSEGKIVGYAVVFEQRTILYTDPETNYEYGEIIDRHALDEADMTDVILRYNHTGRCLARTRNKTLRLTIDDHGLRIEADMTASEEARSFYEDVKSGLIDKMSFQFVPQETKWDPETRTDRVTKIARLLDVAIVDFPAYNQTQVSARDHFQALAEPELRAFHTTQVRTLQAEMLAKISELAPGGASEYRSREEQSAQGESREFYEIPGWGTFSEVINKPSETEAILHDIAALGETIKQNAGSSDLQKANQLRRQLDALASALSNSMIAEAAARAEIRSKVASGAIPAIHESTKNNTTTNEKENNRMDTEIREFYQPFVEAREAGTTTTLTKMIPSTVMDKYVLEQTPGAFYEAASKTTIAHSGSLTLPIATLQDIHLHQENTEIADAGYVPGSIIINHSEYCYKSGYSDLAVTISTENLAKIVGATCLRSMLKKLDGLCIDAVAALVYIENVNSVKITTGAPSFADFVKLASMLGADYLPAAKWRVSPATYFTWLLGLKDNSGRPILDPSKLVSDQALGGYGIEMDSQLASNVVYFGDGSRVHLNCARGPELNSWTDNDHNTQKVSVRAVAGATAEPGCMVKMYLAG